MNYIYDGSFDGLMTIIFNAYNIIEDINIKVESNQLDFFEDSIISKTDLEKSTRVKNFLLKKFSVLYLNNIRLVFLSDSPSKENTIARYIKRGIIYGVKYMNSADENAVEFRRILKNLYSENHTYKGLLRFKEIQDGFLLANIEPHNDILEILTQHFLKRLPKEKFIIYDVKRRKCSMAINGDYKILEVEELNSVESSDEVFFKKAWQGFYKSVGIKERENKKLMMSNMPKKYWKYLPEKNI